MASRLSSAFTAGVSTVPTRLLQSSVLGSLASAQTPAGTRIDNVATHPLTRDYAKRTVDEMGFFWIGWVELTEEEYKTELAARKAAQSSRTQQQQQQ